MDGLIGVYYLVALGGVRSVQVLYDKHTLNCPQNIAPKIAIQLKNVEIWILTVGKL